MTSNPPKKVVIIAGEASGDNHGAKVAKELLAQNPDIKLYGMGSSLMLDAGVELFMDSKDLAVIGITAVLLKLPTFFKAFNYTKLMIDKLKPDLVILIDFPDFNLRLAKYIHKQGIPVLYYVSPQIWAWRRGRAQKIAQNVSHMAAILPFEEEFYAGYNLPVTYVGNPLLDRPLPTVEEVKARQMPANPTIGILPGSRNGEIKRLLDVMLNAAYEISQSKPDVTFLVSQASSVNSALFDEITSRHKNVKFAIAHSAREVFLQSNALIATSGTVTLEAGLHGLPMVIVYKLSFLNALMGALLLRVKCIGLINLVAGKKLMPELVQYQATPKKIAAEVLSIVNDDTRYTEIQNELINVKAKLGAGGASAKVAQIALKLLG